MNHNDAPDDAWDKLPLLGKFFVVIAAIMACSLTAGLLVGYVR